MQNKLQHLLLFCSFLLVLTIPTYAQKERTYSTQQAHSHNDYEQDVAFWKAYNSEFGSIEADLFFVNDSLYVAHDKKDIKPERTFSKLYLEPILSSLKKNNGKIYKNKKSKLQILIDLKTPTEPTLGALVKLLEPYKNALASTSNLTFVISGNVPNPEDFKKYPSYIQFDGRPETTYTTSQLERIGLISQSMRNYTKWIGEGELPKNDKDKIAKVISETNQKGKKIRFWATPDNINAWKTLMKLNVDYLNTDLIPELSDFLKNAPK